VKWDKRNLKLRREGKLNTSGGTIRDLVLGADAPR